MVNCTEALDGTVAQFKCASYYEDSRVSRPKAICVDGRWSEDVPDCRPVCGKIRPKRNPTLIVGGKIAGKRYFPWQAALYNARNQEFLCGGSLLNERIILTGEYPPFMT
jgi:hypothetical protein